MSKKMAFGILMGVFLLYLSFRGIHFEAIIDGFTKIRFRFVLPALAIMIFLQVMRSWRWRAILAPLKKINQWTVFIVTNIGFMAIMALPARLGELARPYLITRKSDISMTSALATILLERIADLLAILLLLVFSLLFLPMPSWLLKPSIIVVCAALGSTLIIALLVFKKERSLKIINGFAGRLPVKYAASLNRIACQLIDGLAVVKDPAYLFTVAFYSIVIWTINVLAIYLMFQAFDFALSPTAALILMIVLIVGIAIPTAPGFIGNWHFFCYLALSLFGISKPDAVTFAVIYHFLSVAVIASLGLASLPFAAVSLSDFRAGIKEAPENSEPARQASSR